jgi:predicted small integral membrane protein
VITGLATLAFLGLIWPFAGAKQPLFTHGYWSLLPMALAALLTAAVVKTFRRWSWTPPHLLNACLGAVAGHTIFGLLSNADTIEDRVFLGVLAAATLKIAWRGRPAGAEGRRRPARGEPVRRQPAAAGGQERCSTSPSAPERT